MSTTRHTEGRSSCQRHSEPLPAADGKRRYERISYRGSIPAADRQPLPHSLRDQSPEPHQQDVAAVDHYAAFATFQGTEQLLGDLLGAHEHRVIRVSEQSGGDESVKRIFDPCIRASWASESM